MKTALIILFPIFTSSFRLIAQTTGDEKAVLTEALHIVSYKKPVVYVKNIPQRSKPSKSITAQLEKGKFYETVPYNDSISVDPVTGQTTMYVQSVDSLILTNEEKQVLINEFGNAVTWEDGLFESSIGVNDQDNGYKTIAAIKDEPQGNRTCAYYYIFSFSKPVFIRDKTVCFISIGAICGGDCGIVDISFYRKKDSQWQQWISIGGGAF